MIRTKVSHMNSIATNPDRRRFLKSSLALAGVASLGRVIAAESGFRIGCWTRSWAKMDYPMVFDAVAEAGYKHVGFMNLTMGGKAAGIGHDTPPESAASLAAEAGKR